MRTFLLCLAMTGLAVTIVGAVNHVGLLILLGLSALTIAAVMTALALPSTLRGGRGSAAEETAHTLSRNRHGAGNRSPRPYETMQESPQTTPGGK